ncbi:MAG: hopanoid biosynthesis associated radical SAM protein HpnJ [Fimbriimonadaceae bacterium]|nr:hopanoid biosynthesis associated radical SAM protein HpnJ [Fimbriimonadaceae bacterium]
MDVKKTLFLNAPSYEGFDGGAGARYQNSREITSFWYPHWLAEPAAMVPGSKLIDAPPHGLSPETVLAAARDYELVVIHTSTPGFRNDVRFAEALKSQNPDQMIGLCGAQTVICPDLSLESSPAIDFVCGGELVFTLLEVAQGRELADIAGLSWRREGQVVHNPRRPEPPDLDVVPSVLDVYKRDLDISKYFNGYMPHPYMSLYTGRGCRSKCTFCLWPQTIGGHDYRVQSVDRAVEEFQRVPQLWPEVKEIFFNDDTFTDNAARTIAIAERIGPVGVPWSANAKPNVSYDTLRVMKENGCRLLLVGFESGNQQILNNIRKGTRLDRIREFVAHCKTLDLAIHGCFIFGLPGETPETIEETIRFAKEMDPESLQVSLAAPYPGTEMYQQAVDNGWFDGQPLLNAAGVQIPAISYPAISAEQMDAAVDRFYKQYYFRPRVIWRLVKPMLTDRDLRRRRLREGRQFLGFFNKRKDKSTETVACESCAG